MLKGKSISQKASSSSVPGGSPPKLVHGVGVDVYPAVGEVGDWLVVLAEPAEELLDVLEDTAVELLDGIVMEDDVDEDAAIVEVVVDEVLEDVVVVVDDVVNDIADEEADDIALPEEAARGVKRLPATW